MNAGPYALGIDLGTTWTAAAIHRGDAVEVASLGNNAPAVPSAVFVGQGEVLVGESAQRRGLTEPDGLAREFKRRIGDPTPLVLNGSPWSAEALTARLLVWATEAVATRENARPSVVVVTHPANWGPYKLDRLRGVVQQAGVEDPVLLSEPEAAAISYAADERLRDGGLVAVYDLGGGTFDAAVLRKSGGRFEIVGRPDGIEHLGGIDFDEAVFAFVLRAIPELSSLDTADPMVRRALSRLRQDCTLAKEGLSADTEAAIPVTVSAIDTEVRLTRVEFEGMIRIPLEDTVASLRRALQSGDVADKDLDAVLLVGGSSRIPLVAEMVGSALQLPVAIDAHPKFAIARGAARVAGAEAAGPELGGSAGAWGGSRGRAPDVRGPAAAAPSANAAPPAAAPPAAAPAPFAPEAPVPAAPPTHSPQSAPPLQPVVVQTAPPPAVPSPAPVPLPAAAHATPRQPLPVAQPSSSVQPSSPVQQPVPVQPPSPVQPSAQPAWAGAGPSGPVGAGAGAPGGRPRSNRGVLIAAVVLLLVVVGGGSLLILQGTGGDGAQELVAAAVDADVAVGLDCPNASAAICLQQAQLSGGQVQVAFREIGVSLGSGGAQALFFFDDSSGGSHSPGFASGAAAFWTRSDPFQGASPDGAAVVCALLAVDGQLIPGSGNCVPIG